MLNIINISSTIDRKNIFKDFNPESETWLVSDLKSKFEIQKILLNDRIVLPEACVFRASELWRKFLTQIRPDIRVTSSDLVRVTLQDFLNNTTFDWANTPGASKTLLNYLNQLLPIIIHPEGDEILAQWFKSNPDSLIRWGHWYELCKKAWAHLKKLNMTLPQWVSILLLSEDLTRVSGVKDITIDLGAELNLLEAELIQNLSTAGFNIRVLMPKTPWTGQYKISLSAYASLLSETSESVRTYDHLKNKPKIKWAEFSTEIAEVKNAVASIREHLDNGIAPDKLAIVAPDIEKYWPSLSTALECEGVLVNKPKVAPLSHFAEIVSWVSRIKVFANKVKTSDLEMDLYNTNEPVIQYADFKRFFNNIFEPSDLNRDKRVNKNYKNKINTQLALNCDEFVGVILKLWHSNGPVDRMEQVLHKIYQETPSDLYLKFDNWMSYLEGVISKSEVLIKEAHTGGVHCENLASADWLGAEYVYIIGACEGNLSSTVDVALSSREVLLLSQQAGFNLPHPEQKGNEFDLQWLIQEESAGLHVSYSASNFLGQVQAPSKIWLVGLLLNDGDSHVVSLPKKTRIDELQEVSLSTLKKNYLWSDDFFNMYTQFLNQDLGEFTDTPLDDKIRLSVSQVENYIKCPYIFTAQKVLGLSDLPELDLDIDRMSRGKLMHALFEELTVEPIKWDHSDQELIEIIDRCRAKESIHLGDEAVWPLVRAQHVQLAKRFLAFESSWRDKYKQTTTIARELEINGQWSCKEKDFSAEGDFDFKGFIDRVDKDDNGNYAVIDYKSSAGQAKNYKSWVSNNTLQLGLYAYAVEQGLTELTKGSVVAAQYFVSRTMDRTKGFQQTDADQALVPPDADHFRRIDAEAKNQLYLDIKEVFNKVACQIKSGNFNPVPEDIKTCPTCQWIKICRAPHLNR